MDPTATTKGIARLETGIPGVDALTRGGFPLGRSTLVGGSAGTGKTIMASQFLIAGIERYEQPGVFVALEETPSDLQDNMRGLGWDIASHIDSGMWAFVDGAPRGGEDFFAGGAFDLQPLADQIIAAAKRIEAKRVSIDSIAALLARFPDAGTIRREMYRLIAKLREQQITALITAERVDEDQDSISRFGVEEFVVDSVILLRNRSEDARRRRTIEILKLRGGAHFSGEFPFSVGETGITAIPVGTMEMTAPSSVERIDSGCEELNRMCGGGYFQDSVAIVSGATGTGKTLTATTFLKGGAQHGHRSLFYGFEESHHQLFRNSKSWGIDLHDFEQRGLVRLRCQFPESGSLEDHLNHIRRDIVEFKPQRIVVDSISALQRIGSDHAFREFVIGLTSLIKHHQVAGLYTTTSEQLIGGTSVTGQHISTLTDTIIMLSYAERESRLSRGMTVLKMRGSPHEKSIREFTISEKGMEIGGPLGGVFHVFGSLQSSRSSDS